MNKLYTRLLVISLVFVVCTSLMQAQVTIPTFTHKHHDTTIVGNDTIISLGLFPLMGGGLNGAAWFDYNYDGWLDLYVIGGAPGKLFKNDLANSGRFIKVSKETLEGPEEGALIDTGVHSGSYCIAGYFDGDTLIDLLRSLNVEYGIDGLYLYVNQGPEQNFRLVRKEGAFTFPFHNTNFVGIGAGDIEPDGDLDLAYSGYCAKGPMRVFTNDGSGVFTENTASMVVGMIPEMESWTAVFTDYNNDGYVDLWLGNMQRALNSPVFLYRNDQNGKLEYTDPEETGLVIDSAVIACAWGDYDNDGYMDLWTSNFRDESGRPAPAFLFRNNRDGTFTDVKEEVGISDPHNTYYFSRGADWQDFNNDGWVDLYVGSRGDDMQRLYINNGDGTFIEASVDANARVTPAYDMSRKLTCVDFNNDGWVDIWAHGQNLRCVLLQNNGGTNNWIQFIPSPAEGSSNKVLTSRITISAEGLPDQIREIEGGTGNGSSGRIRAHFGLGSATQVTSVKVRWSNGVEEGPYTTDVAGAPIMANQFYVIKEGLGLYRFETGGVGPSSARVKGYALAQNYPNPFNPTTKISFTLPTRSNVKLVVMNVLGQVVKEVVNGVYNAGNHTIEFNASGLASGVYFYRLQAGDYTDVKKMVLLK